MTTETIFAVCAALVFGIVMAGIVLLNYHVNVSLAPLDFPKGHVVIHLQHSAGHSDAIGADVVRGKLTSLYLFSPKQISGC